MLLTSASTVKTTRANCMMNTSCSRLSHSVPWTLSARREWVYFKWCGCKGGVESPLWCWCLRGKPPGRNHKRETEASRLTSVSHRPDSWRHRPAVGQRRRGHEDNGNTGGWNFASGLIPTLAWRVALLSPLPPAQREASRLRSGGTICSNSWFSLDWQPPWTASLDMSKARRSGKVSMLLGRAPAAVRLRGGGPSFSCRCSGISTDGSAERGFQMQRTPKALYFKAGEFHHRPPSGLFRFCRVSVSWCKRAACLRQSDLSWRNCWYNSL